MSTDFDDPRSDPSDLSKVRSGRLKIIRFISGPELEDLRHSVVVIGQMTTVPNSDLFRASVETTRQGRTRRALQGSYSPSRGKSSGGTRTRRLRACPGTREMSPLRWSVSTIWWMVGGFLRK